MASIADPSVSASRMGAGSYERVTAKRARGGRCAYIEA
jgi:hypothetical protein